MFERITLIGLGLMGGSLALALRRAWPGSQVTGYDIGAGLTDDANARAVEGQARLALVHRLAANLADALCDADLVIIATPVSALDSVFAALAEHLPRTCLVVDVTSTKQSAIAWARQHLGTAMARFVPCHPIAGSEASGSRAARIDLLLGKTVVMTPLSEHTPDTLARVTALWHALGARTVSMQAEDHDALFAYLSHAPHLLAFAWMLEAERLPEPSEGVQLAGSGFRDFTRIAASSASLWADILLDNRGPVGELIGRHIERLSGLRAALEAGRRAELVDQFGRAAALRRALA